MKNLHLSSCYAVAAAALVGLAACAGESTSPSEFKSPTSARFALGDVTDATPVVGKVKVCKSAGSNVSGDFSVSRTPFGPNSSGTVSATATVDPGECIVVAEDESGSGSASDVIVDETSLGFVSATAVGTDGPVAVYTDGATSLRINSFHGFTITYVNHVEEDEGCTLTQGYWKNHSEEWADLADDQFFSSGKTYLQILQTPVKGSAYIQLAHQYIAAYLNIQGGASTTPAVDAAMATALTYFTNGTGNISGLVGILDAYNNGVTGPGHCDDQEVILQ